MLYFQVYFEHVFPSAAFQSPALGISHVCSSDNDRSVYLPDGLLDVEAPETLVHSNDLVMVAFKKSKRGT